MALYSFVLGDQRDPRNFSNGSNQACRGGRGASDQSFTPEFDAISEVAMKQWTVEHRMFPYDAYVLRKDYFYIQEHLVPPPPQDFSSRNLFLWDYLKSRILSRMLDEVKEAIRDEK